MILATILARGGSKRIPRKNLKEIDGKTLIEHAVESVYGIDVIVSSDDDEIGRIAIKAGAKFQKRPKELARDTTSSFDAWEYVRSQNPSYEINLLIEPTCPLRNREDITRCIDALKDHDSACTVSRLAANLSPEKLVQIRYERIAFYTKQYAPRRQNLPAYYHFNGACYATKIKKISAYEFFRDCKAIEIKRPIVNIDEPFDLEIARYLKRKLYAEGEAIQSVRNTAENIR